jgi:hypothetical protein
VWQRALRGDRDIVPYVLAKLGDNRRWLHVVPHIWERAFEPVVDNALTHLAIDPGLRSDVWSNNAYYLANLVRDIPTAVAERLLEQHWAGLGEVPLFIHAALYHGTDMLRAVAADSLGRLSPEADPFRHVDSFFGFFTQGLSDRLTVRHLETLLPYLERLESHCLQDMLRFCRRFDHWDWAVRHLEPECRRRANTVSSDQSGLADRSFVSCFLDFPTDNYLLSELDKIEQIDRRHWDGHLWFWWEQFEERGDPPECPRRLLERWLTQSPCPERFVAVAVAIRQRGTRRDLEWLRAHALDLSLRAVGEALADAEFAVMRRSLD